MKRLKTTALSLTLWIFPLIVSAQTPRGVPIAERIRKSFNFTAQYAGFTEGYRDFQGNEFLGFMGAYINTIFGLIGVVFLIWTILGGWWWMTAGGNDEKVNKAKKTVINSSIGIGIIFFSLVITNFVLNLLERSISGT